MFKIPPDVDKLQFLKDIFASNQYKLVDTYVIDDGKEHPFAIIVPGGAYCMVCNYIEGKPFAQKLNELGISCFILYYRVKSKAHFPAPMDDLAHAVEEVFQQSDKYHIDKTNFSIWGSSAGGHLAASFGTDTMGYIKYNLPKPNAIVLAYPVITMDPAFTHKMSHDSLLGENAAKEDEDMASIEKNVTSEYPSTFVWCGENDSIVSPENTRMMGDALENAGVPHEMNIFPDAQHGVGPGTGTFAEGWINKAVDFWMKQKK